MTEKPASNIKLIVGLGNPGPRFQETRHNAGFLALDHLAKRWDTNFKKEKLAFKASFKNYTLLKPTTYMNLSGKAVLAYLSKLRLNPDALLVIYDDLDLPLGRLRFKTGGGSGGARGVQDIIQTIGPSFLRLKLGIGRPPERWTTENWVLSKFAAEEKPLLDKVLTHSADAVEHLLQEGLKPAMNHFNGLDVRDS